MKIPNGWRPVKGYEIIKEGDKYWSSDMHAFARCLSSVGRICDEIWDSDDMVIRQEVIPKLSNDKIKELLKTVCIRTITSNPIYEAEEIVKILKNYFPTEIGLTTVEETYKYHNVTAMVCCIKLGIITMATNLSWVGLTGLRIINLKELNELLNLSTEISDEIKTGIINKLKQERAFNEDSALKVGESEFYTYSDLATMGAIKMYDKRFFVCQ